MKQIMFAIVLAACGGGDAGKPKPAPPKPATTVGSAAAPATSDTKELTGSVKSIKVEGATGSVKTQVETSFAAAKGKALETDQVRVLLTEVMKTPGVADVTLQGTQLADGIELVLQVKMQPTLKKLTAIETGGKTIPLGIAAMPVNGPLEPHKIQTLATGLRDRYVANGHFDAEVSWKRVDVAGGVEVVIELKPGETAMLGSVAYKGAKVAKKTLDAQIAKWLIADQPVNHENIGAAAEAIYRYYWDVGYANVKVKVPKPVAGKNAIVFEIDEGPKFKMGKIEIKGLPDADHAKYKKVFGVKQGDVFSRSKIAEGRDRMAKEIAAAGKPAAEVLPLTTVDLKKKTIALTLEVSGAN